MTSQIYGGAVRGFTITRMSEHDLLEVVEIEESSGLSRWGWTAYYAELQGRHNHLMLVARLNRDELADHAHQVAGYIVARLGADELHINNFAVRSRHRRKGIGLELLQRILAEGKSSGAASAFLELRAGNKSALALYEKCGFRVTARRKSYYYDPLEDALVMSLQLQPTA